MEIIINFDENGRLTISKTENMDIFTAVGILELSKKALLEPNNKGKEEITEEVEDVL